MWVCWIFPAQEHGGECPGLSALPLGPGGTSLPTLCVLADPPACSLPKAPDLSVLLWSCFPACAQEWGEPCPVPLSPPLRAAPFLPWGSEKLTDSQGGGHLSSLHPGPCSPALGFPPDLRSPTSHPTQPVSPGRQFCPCRDPLRHRRDCTCWSALLRGSGGGYRGPREEGFFRHTGVRGPPNGPGLPSPFSFPTITPWLA